jgi:ArsR family transcriptional regulator
MQPEKLFSLMSDPTRLRALMLIQAEGELCVCELTWALEASQPKVSRHLALMRESGLVEARREGTWMFYRLSPGLPDWVTDLMASARERLAGLDAFAEDRGRLGAMRDRPEARRCA